MSAVAFRRAAVAPAPVAAPPAAEGSSSAGGRASLSGGGLSSWLMRRSHTVVLVASFCVCCLSDELHGSGLLATGLGLGALLVLSAERHLVLSRGGLWRPLHVSAYGLLLLVLLFQA